MVHSYNYFNKFMEQIIRVVDTLGLFWRELSIRKPEIKRLEKLGFWISEESESLDHKFKDMDISHSYKVQATLVYVAY